MYLHCPNNGRPALDPIVFKLLLFGYLFGIRSERELKRDVGVMLYIVGILTIH